MRVTFPIAVALALSISVSSQPAIAQSDGANVTKDLGCGGFVPTATGGIGAIIYTTDSVVIVKGPATTSLSCHFNIPAGLEPKGTTRAAGFPCFTWLGLTYDTRMQANSGGNATLSCRIRTK